MNEPWIEYKHIWPTKAKFFAFLRGNLRRAVWEKWPGKIEFKNEKCKPPPEDYTGRAKSGAYCELTGEWIGKSAAEIDHIRGHVSLNDWEDVLPFIIHLCASKDNMAYVGKEAHRIKSYAERMGISFQDALIAKQVIALQKNKEDIAFLKSKGYTPASNQAKRKAQLIEILTEETQGGEMAI